MISLRYNTCICSYWHTHTLSLYRLYSAFGREQESRDSGSNSAEFCLKSSILPSPPLVTLYSKMRKGTDYEEVFFFASSPVVARDWLSRFFSCFKKNLQARLALMMPLWSLGDVDLRQVAQEAGTTDIEAWQVCKCMYVHTCCVLTNTPIPSSRCKHFVILRPVKILLHARGHKGPPLQRPLRMFFFLICDVITSYFIFFVLHNSNFVKKAS